MGDALKNSLNSLEKSKSKAPRILLIEPNAKKRKLLALNLNVYLASEIVTLADAEEVRQFFQNYKNNFDLIICTQMVQEENTILKVYYFVNSGKLKIPIILMGEEPKLKGSIEQIEAHKWEKIIKTSAKMLGVTAKDMADLEVPEYYPFPIEQFVPVVEAPVHIYEKNTETESGFKLVFEKDKVVNQDYISSLILKKVPELYVKKDVRLDFASGFSNQIIEYLKDDDLSIKDRTELAAQAYNDALHRVREIGLDQHAIETCQAVINSMYVTTQSKDKLSDLLDIIVNNSGSYMYRHSLIISMLSANVLDFVEWGNEE